VSGKAQTRHQQDVTHWLKFLHMVAAPSWVEDPSFANDTDHNVASLYDRPVDVRNRKWAGISNDWRTVKGE